MQSEQKTKNKQQQQQQQKTISYHSDFMFTIYLPTAKIDPVSLKIKQES